MAFRVLRYGATASSVRWYAAEQARAERLQVEEHESAAFDANGLRPPRDPQLDLAAKACLAVPLLLGGIAIWQSDLSATTFGGANVATQHGGEAAIVVFDRETASGMLAVTLGFLGALRLAWLALELRKRQARWPSRQTFRLPAITSLLVLTAGFGLLALRDNRPPSFMFTIAPITERTLEKGSFEVRFGCSEDCSLSKPRFVDGRDRDPRNPGLSRPEIVDNGLLPGPIPISNELSASERRNLEGYAWELPDFPTQRNDIEVSTEQARWLAQELACPEGNFDDDCGRTFMFDMRDAHGNIHSTGLELRSVAPK